MNDRFDIVEGDVSIVDGRIAAIAPNITAPHDRVIDARGGYVLPGLIQTHIHLCQTLFRGFADDLPLMDWLRRRVWPMEAAHTPATLRASTRLATTELLASGTTSVLTMETVHDTDVVFEAVAESGLRATIGKCMMDFDAQVPARLQEDTQRSLGREPGDPHALAWRGRRSSARGVRAPLRRVRVRAPARDRGRAVRPAQRAGAHARRRVARRDRDRQGDIGRPDQPGVSRQPAARLAAPVHGALRVGRRRRSASAGRTRRQGDALSRFESEAGLGHRPVVEMRARGITVSLGADGAACNNRLDMFEEMRLAAILQATRKAPGILPAREVLWMATRAGARTLGREDEIGSLEVGKRADVIVVDRDRPHLAPGPDPYSTLVYAARGPDVRTTIVDGTVLVDDFESVRSIDLRSSPTPAPPRTSWRRAPAFADHTLNSSTDDVI
jgi:cytosine/adenosine deaminase-related metal-dependent hydrolase